MLKIEIENKAAVKIHGLAPGARKKINADEKGTPLEKHWRRRLHDSAIDGAIVKVEAAKKTRKSEIKED